MQAELFQEQTELIVNSLVKQSEQAGIKMQEMNQRAESIQHVMRTASVKQQVMVEEQERMYKQLKDMSKEEQDRFDHLGKELLNFNRLTDEMQQGMKMLSKENQQLLSEQQSFYKYGCK